MGADIGRLDARQNVTACNVLAQRRAHLDAERSTLDEHASSALAMSDARAINVRSMSAHEATLEAIARIIGDRTSENGSSLHGLLAMLALPPRRGVDGVFRRQLVEVEIAPDRWAAVEELSIDCDGMTFSWGRNGGSVEYRFEGMMCPRWRVG